MTPEARRPLGVHSARISAASPTSATLSDPVAVFVVLRVSSRLLAPAREAPRLVVPRGVQTRAPWTARVSMSWAGSRQWLCRPYWWGFPAARTACRRPRSRIHAKAVATIQWMKGLERRPVECAPNRGSAFVSGLRRHGSAGAQRRGARPDTARSRRGSPCRTDAYECLVRPAASIRLPTPRPTTASPLANLYMAPH